MARFLRSSEETAGLSPLSPVFVGNQKIDKSIIRIFDYDQNSLEELNVQNPEDVARFLETDTVTWISVYGHP